jgi:hypothetical protein
MGAMVLRALGYGAIGTVTNLAAPYAVRPMAIRFWCRCGLRRSRT